MNDLLSIIDLLFILCSIPVIVLLYYQWKEMVKQEQFIKSEAESLRRLQEINSCFSDFGLFGLQEESPYLQIGVPKSNIPKLRKQVLARQSREKKKLVKA